LRLQDRTWREVDQYLSASDGILLPTGSTEQHGPVGLIGTDTLCAEAVALAAAERSGALVAPPLAYGPAQFNEAFAGTVSIRAATFAALAGDVFDSLRRGGFRRIYVINGHGGDIGPLRGAIHDALWAENRRGPIETGEPLRLRLKSWWEFPAVDALRQEFYGAREGMHGTPSEVAITRALGRTVSPDGTESAVEPLSATYLRDHAGDLHDSALEHRRRFPDGRVGSDSDLGSAKHGRQLLDAAATALAEDYAAFLAED